MRPLTRRVCAKALALTSTSNNSENTDERILFIPVLLLGWVRLAATGAASPAELKGLCLAFSWPLFMGRDMRCQDQRKLISTSSARDLQFPKRKNAGQKAGVSYPILPPFTDCRSPFVDPSQSF